MFFFLHSPIANAAGHRLTERERGTSEKRNNSSTLRRRCVHSWFADRPFFRFSSHSLSRAHRGVLISITFGSQTRIGPLSSSFLLSFSPFRWNKKPRLAERQRRRRRKRKTDGRGRGTEGTAEFNFSHSRSSVSVRIFIPFRATTRPVISFAENSRGYLTPATLFPSPLLSSTAFSFSAASFAIFLFAPTRRG